MSRVGRGATLGLLDARTAAQDAYKAHAGEADAFQTQDLVKASIKQQRP